MNPITEFRIYMRLRPYIGQLKKEIRMNKVSAHSIVQVIGTVVQAANAAGALVPPGTPQVALGASVAILQGIAAIIALFQHPPTAAPKA